LLQTNATVAHVSRTQVDHTSSMNTAAFA